MSPLRALKWTVKNVKVSLVWGSDQLLSFDWFNTYIPKKIPGLFFGNVNCTKFNIECHLQSLQNTIAAWKHRDLSFKGKPS